MMLCVSCHEELDQRVEICPKCGQGTMLEGRFVLERVLGHGASGTTYRGRDAQSGRPVAIKEFSLRRAESLKAIELFEREVATLKALKHKGIPAFVASATVERPGQLWLYLVQELIEGSELELGGDWDEVRILEMVADLSKILVYLHSRTPPIIHRDIKPSNLMRRRDGRLVLIDFGSVRQISREVGGDGGSTVAGTFGYMAPEQLRGVATPASDLYSVGATAVALFAGQDAAKIVDPINPSAWRSVVRASPETIVLLGRLLQAVEASRMSDAAAPVQEPVTALTSVRQAELMREIVRDFSVMR